MTPLFLYPHALTMQSWVSDLVLLCLNSPLEEGPPYLLFYLPPGMSVRNK